MAMTFEQVSADIQREPRHEEPAEPAPPAAGPDLAAQLEQLMRQQAEREARTCDR
jgi:hypothetical protein